MTLRLKKYSKSPYWQIRGSIGGTLIHESTQTEDLALATELLNKRNVEVYRDNLISVGEWVILEPPMIKELSYLAMRARNRSQKRKQSDRITTEMVTAMFLKQKGRCAMSGIPFRLDELRPGVPHSRAFAPSLDRLDNAKGYVPDNVRLVCRIANFAMNTWGDKALLELSLAIASFWERVCAEIISGAKTVQKLENEGITQ